MKCCGCFKEIDTTIPDEYGPTWYGKYVANKLIAIICSDCIKDSKKKDKYQNLKIIGD